MDDVGRNEVRAVRKGGDADCGWCCPHIGTLWDSSIPFTKPDAGNRCYARFAEHRVYVFFIRRTPGASIPLEHQRVACYADYRGCQYFRRKTGTGR